MELHAPRIASNTEGEVWIVTACCEQNGPLGQCEDYLRMTNMGRETRREQLEQRIFFGLLHQGNLCNPKFFTLLVIAYDSPSRMRQELMTVADTQYRFITA